MKILLKTIIIDDDKIATEQLKTELAKYSMLDICGNAYTGTEGRILLLETNPDLIFLDVELPDCMGFDFLHSVKNLLKKDCHVVFYTAYNKYLIKALREKAFDYLLKPINQDELSIVLGRVLDESYAKPETVEPKIENEQVITGLDQEIIVTDAILSDLQQSKAKSDAEHAQQQQIALERKRERLEAQSLADAHKRATDFHTAFDLNHPDKSLVTQYITDYALLARHGKQPQPPAPVEEPQPTWWQRMTGQQPQQIEQPPFFEIEVVKATAQAIVEHEKKQAQQQKWQRLQEFLQYSPSTVDRLERDAISRSFDKGQQAGDEELAEFIKYHRSHWKEKEQAAKDWQAEYDRFMRDEAAKEKAELEAQRQRERESEARLEAYRAERDRNAQTQKPVNRDEPIPKPRPKNDFEP